MFGLLTWLSIFFPDLNVVTPLTGFTFSSSQKCTTRELFFGFHSGWLGNFSFWLFEVLINKFIIFSILLIMIFSNQLLFSVRGAHNPYSTRPNPHKPDLVRVGYGLQFVTHTIYRLGVIFYSTQPYLKPIQPNIKKLIQYKPFKN